VNIMPLFIGEGVTLGLCAAWIRGLYGSLWEHERQGGRKDDRIAWLESDADSTAKIVSDYEREMQHLRRQNNHLRQIVEGTPGVLNDPVQIERREKDLNAAIAGAITSANVAVNRSGPKVTVTAAGPSKASGKVTVVEYPSNPDKIGGGPVPVEAGVEARVTRLEQAMWGKR
jgi:hypothetical protein